MKEKKEKPYTYHNFSVWYGKREIARRYVDPGKPDQLRVLQGVPRSEVIKKICRDLPDLCKELGITENYYPYLFSTPRKYPKD